MEHPRPRLTIPIVSLDNEASTAPIIESTEGRSGGNPRHFSFSSRASAIYNSKRGVIRTESQYSRTLSQTYTITSNASSSIPMEEWKPIFDKFDLESDGIIDGKIPLDKFKALLEEDPLWTETLPSETQIFILDKVDRNQDGVIDINEFYDLVKGKNLGFSQKRRRALRELLKESVEFIMPYKYSYQNEYSCSPPPLFMILLSFLQIFIFTINGIIIYKKIGFLGLNGPVPYCSHLIYNPNKREEIWRFISYMFVHSGLFHLFFNVIIQLILGIPLEMVNGWWRVMTVYLAGVLSGSLWTSVIRPTVFLSGASGGVYALIMAHLGTVIMNFREMSCPWPRVIAVLLIVSVDVFVCIHDILSGEGIKPISYPAHVSGAITGLLVGITVLRNLHWEKYERVIWYLSLGVFVALLLTAILWNLFDSAHFTGVPMNIPCLSNFIL